LGRWDDPNVDELSREWSLVDVVVVRGSQPTGHGNLIEPDSREQRYAFAARPSCHSLSQPDTHF
jgi:hypothetical protein